MTQEQSGFQRMEERARAIAPPQPHPPEPGPPEPPPPPPPTVAYASDRARHAPLDYGWHPDPVLIGFVVVLLAIIVIVGYSVMSRPVSP